MDKREMLKQLQENRTNKFKKKEHWKMVNVGQPVQISKAEGSFYEHLVVVRSDDPVSPRCAIVQYKGMLPKRFDLRDDSQCQVMKTSLVSRLDADIVEDAIETWIDYKHYHINAYNFILTYCLVKGVDLVEMGVIDL